MGPCAYPAKKVGLLYRRDAGAAWTSFKNYKQARQTIHAGGKPPRPHRQFLFLAKRGGQITIAARWATRPSLPTLAGDLQSLLAGGWPKLYSVCAPSGTKHEFDDTSGFSGSDTEVGSFPSSRCCLSKAEYCWRVTSSSFDRFSKLAGSEPLSRKNSCRIDRSRIIRSSSSSRAINSARHNFLTASCRSTLPPRARQISRRSSRLAKPVPAFTSQSRRHVSLQFAGIRDIACLTAPQVGLRPPSRSATSARTVDQRQFDRCCLTRRPTGHRTCVRERRLCGDPFVAVKVGNGSIRVDWLPDLDCRKQPSARNCIRECLLPNRAAHTGATRSWSARSLGWTCPSTDATPCLYRSRSGAASPRSTGDYRAACRRQHRLPGQGHPDR